MKKRSWCQSSHYSEHILIIKHQLTTKPAKTPNRIQQQAHSRPPNRQFTSFLNQTRLSISSRLSSITLSKRKGKSIKNKEMGPSPEAPLFIFFKATEHHAHPSISSKNPSSPRNEVEIYCTKMCAAESNSGARSSRV